ncbi:MAG TPA: hypothetical protein VG456_11555 [Candidatus Sulfopaludibacter sp.]|jgi:uncharacterized protein (TIGR03437 family)|nr:hypothetical protein [Candidatus Sulfopaludibacter sp.]
MMRQLLRVISSVIVCGVALTAQNVVTGNYGNERTNANLSETILATGNVVPGSFGKLGSFPVDGQVYAQPLYLSGVAVSGHGSHNLLFVCTQHNSVYAYDADSAASPNLLWTVNLGPSVPSSTFGDYGSIAPEIGILSTPTLDAQQGVLYVVADTLQNGGPQFQLHALDIQTGQEMRNGPVTISGQVAGSGAGSANGVLAFDPFWHIQRPGLLLLNGMVTMTFGSHDDDGPWHGWVFTYDGSDLSKSPSVWNTTANGVGGAIWQSGRGLAADSSNIYAITGNGDYDGAANFSETFVKLTGSAPALTDWYTPPNFKDLSDADFDLAAGAAIMPGTHTVIGGDKAGHLYLIDGANMGHGTSGSAQIIQAVPSGGIFNFAIWNRQDSAYVYVPELNSSFKAYQVAGGAFNPTPVSATTSGGTDPYEGLAISANGSTDGTGILWATTGDNTQPLLPGTLHAYDAGNLSNEIWNSDMSGGNDFLGTFAKFVSPTVVNGNVYVPTWSNAVVVYGLLPAGTGGQPQPAIGGVANSASFAVNAVSPGELVSIFGNNVGPAIPAGIQFDFSGSVVTLIGGTQVLFDGVAAPMIYASNGQVNAVVPFGLTGSTTQVQVVYNGLASPAFPMTVLPATPAAFTQDGSGAGQAAALNQDYSPNSSDNPAVQGSVVTIYAEGAGQMNPPGQDGSVVSASNLPQTVLPVTVTVGGLPATVIYAGGAPGFVEGLLQVNFQLPDGAPSGPVVPVVIQVGAIASKQSITISIQ